MSKPAGTIKQLTDGMVYTVVRVVIALVGIFPYASLHWFNECLAWFFTYLIPIRRGVLLDNLSHAFPEKSRKEQLHLIKKMWTHLLSMGVEFFIGRRIINETNWRQFISIQNAAETVRKFFSNRPLIMVTGHFGNFELGGFFLGLLGYPTYSIARSLDNPYLNRYVARVRESTGQFLIEKNGGSEEIMSRIESGEIVSFLADQSAGHKGCWVEFFQRSASAYKAIALLSLQYNAPILVCSCPRLKEGKMVFSMNEEDYYDPLDPNEGEKSLFEITQWFTEVLEKAIRKSPEQYWWLHRRWKTYDRVVPVEKIRAKRKVFHNNL